MQHFTVELDLPNSVRLPDNYSFRDAMVASLYRQGVVSAGEASEAIGIPRRDLEDSLSQYGVSAVNQEQISYDLKNIDQS